VAIIVVGASTPGALAAKAVTQTIPIVFFIGTDPAKVGLVASLARPGGNITGITVLTVELIAKSLELMHNLMLQPPRLRCSSTRPTSPKPRLKEGMYRMQQVSSARAS